MTSAAIKTSLKSQIVKSTSSAGTNGFCMLAALQASLLAAIFLVAASATYAEPTISNLWEKGKHSREKNALFNAKTGILRPQNCRFHEIVK